MKRLILSTLAGLMLAGCSSAPAGLNYYLLHSPAFELPANDGQSRGQLRMDKLTLPDYLKQRGLAMQTGPATVFFSAQHVWAEPLASGMLQALTESLWRDQQVEVFTQSVYEQAEAIGVTLQLHDFIATHEGDVVLKGQYWLFPPNRSPVQQRFDYRVALDQDGFDHTVEKMRELVARLAKDLAQDSLALQNNDNGTAAAN